MRYVCGMSSGRCWASMVGDGYGVSGGQVQVRKRVLRDPLLVSRM